LDPTINREGTHDWGKGFEDQGGSGKERQLVERKNLGGVDIRGGIAGAALKLIKRGGPSKRGERNKTGGGQSVKEPGSFC